MSTARDAISLVRRRAFEGTLRSVDDSRDARPLHEDPGADLAAAAETWRWRAT